MTSIESWDVMEQKKWLVNRVEVQLENFIKEFTTARQTFTSYAGRIDIEFKDWRSIILAAVALIVSLILGLSRNQLGNSYPFIITVIIGGIIAFVILSIARRKAYSIVQDADVAFLNAIGKLNYLNGYFIGRVVNLQGMEIEKLNFFYKYTVFAASAVQLFELDAYTKVYRSVLLRSLRSRVRPSIDSTKNSIDLTFISYPLHFERDFHRYESEFSALKGVHNTFLERYKIIYPNPRIKINSNGDTIGDAQNN